VQRTLKFSEHLPHFGWLPIVLSAKPYAYRLIDNDQQVVPEEVKVYRAFALDATKHLAFKGKYFGVTSIPDRYSTWIIPAIIKGIYAIVRHRPRVILSTFPIPSAHLIGLVLSRLFSLPWVADFRDPAPIHDMKDEDTNFLNAWVDRSVVAKADLLVFATEAMRQLYREKYPSLAAERTITIENGYNEDVFNQAHMQAQRKVQVDQTEKKTFNILHSGTLYENGRSPIVLFRALENIRFHFRGSELTPDYKAMIRQCGIGQHVEFKPPVSYNQSLQEMLAADALLLIQGELFNYQIPGKVYEYLASDKPILALVGKGGASEDLLRNETACLVETEVVEVANAILALKNIKNINRDKAKFARKNCALMLSQALLLWRTT